MGKLLIFGDSIVFGKWDSQGGWVARLRQEIDEKYNLKGTNNLQVHNLGVPGDLVKTVASRLKREMASRVAPEDNKLVIISVGVNDSNPTNWLSGKQTPKESFLASFSKLFSEIKSFGNAKILVLGLAPVNPEKIINFKGFTNEYAQQYDGFIKKTCATQSVSLLPLFKLLNEHGYQDTLIDGIHPNDQGHNLIHHEVSQYLKKNNLIDWCDQD